MAQSASTRIAALRAEIKELKNAALAELMERRNSLTQQLAQVNVDIAELRGEQPEAKKRSRQNGSPSTTARNLPLQELKELLAAAPEKTLNVRRENLNPKNIKTLAHANPHLLKLGGKGRGRRSPC